VKWRDRLLTLPVLGRWFLVPVYLAVRYLVVYRPWLSDERAVSRVYKRRLGMVPDLQTPRRFNEKIQWLKLHDRTALKVRCSDKIKVRGYIAERVGPEYAVPLIYETCDPGEITYDVLPVEGCVVKTSHDQGTVFMLNGREHENLRVIRELLRIALKRNLYHQSREWPYDRVDRKILIEPNLCQENSGTMKDYKFFCFNGDPRVIQVDHDRFSEHTRNIYSASWNPLKVAYGYACGAVEQAPPCLDEMLYVARELSRPFRFVRVDFYVVNGKPLVGEMTFFPTGGVKPFSPDSFDRELGDMLPLPAVNEYEG